MVKYIQYIHTDREKNFARAESQKQILKKQTLWLFGLRKSNTAKVCFTLQKLPKCSELYFKSLKFFTCILWQREHPLPLKQT